MSGFTPEQLAQIAELIAATNATPAQEQAAPKSRKQETSAKAKEVRRNMDPIDVDTGVDNLVFRVIAANAGGPLSNGARVLPVVTRPDGKEVPARSWDDAIICAFTANVQKQVRSAIATVNKRAKLGEHRDATLKS